MSGFTPGPWKATKDPHGSRDDYCIGMATDVARIDRVAVCSACDANLIAAAPELLEALEYIAGLTGYANCDVCNDVSSTARAAIAKATGGQP